MFYQQDLSRWVAAKLNGLGAVTWPCKAEMPAPPIWMPDSHRWIELNESLNRETQRFETNGICIRDAADPKRVTTYRLKKPGASEALGVTSDGNLLLFERFSDFAPDQIGNLTITRVRLAGHPSAAPSEGPLLETDELVANFSIPPDQPGMIQEIGLSPAGDRIVAIVAKSRYGIKFGRPPYFTGFDLVTCDSNLKNMRRVSSMDKRIPQYKSAEEARAARPMGYKEAEPLLLRWMQDGKGISYTINGVLYTVRL